MNKSWYFVNTNMNNDHKVFISVVQCDFLFHICRATHLHNIQKVKKILEKVEKCSFVFLKQKCVCRLRPEKQHSVWLFAVICCSCQHSTHYRWYYAISYSPAIKQHIFFPVLSCLCESAHCNGDIKKTSLKPQTESFGSFLLNSSACHPPCSGINDNSSAGYISESLCSDIKSQ